MKKEEHQQLHKHHKRRVRMEAFIGIFVLIAVVSIWRGVWGLLDEYLFKDNPPLSFFISIIVGLAILGVTHYHIKEII